MANYVFTDDYDTEVPVKAPGSKNASKEVKLPVTFSLLSESDYQSMLKAVSGHDLEEANTWLEKMIKSVSGVYIAGKVDYEGKPVMLDPETEGVEFAINNVMVRRAMLKKYISLMQSNTFQGQ